MTNPATTTDLEARWRPLTSQEEVNGQTFIDDAWVILKRRFPSLETDLATDADLSDDVVRVIATAVLRVMKNPDGKIQEAIDDYSWQRGQAVADGLLYFTDDELIGLDPASSGSAFSIRGYGEPDSTGTTIMNDWEGWGSWV